MTDLIFKINGTDFSDVVTKYGYDTALVPVEASRYVDLDKRNHVVVAHWRYILTLQINPLAPARAKALVTALKASPLSVQFHSFQENANVTKTMAPPQTDMADGFIFSAKHYTNNTTLQLEEL